MKYLRIIIIAIVLAVIGTVIWWFEIRGSHEGQVACTMEAKLCPDGSAIGRTGPNCEFAACPGQIKGKISIGPLCPVEPCSVTVPNPYVSRQIMLEPQDNQISSSTIYIEINSDGTFQQTVPANIYKLNLTDCNFLGCQRSLPMTVEVVAGTTTEVDIDIDTGIR